MFAVRTHDTEVDINGIDLFALMGALGLIGDQTALASLVDHLVDIMAGTLLTRR